MATSNVNETDDLTTCVVCFERYDNRDRLPKYLLCLHTFCISCLSVECFFFLLKEYVSG